MKFKVDSWVDKPVSYTDKWYKFFVSDVNLDIIESELFSLFALDRAQHSDPYSIIGKMQMLYSFSLVPKESRDFQMQLS